MKKENIKIKRFKWKILKTTKNKKKTNNKTNSNKKQITKKKFKLRKWEKYCCVVFVLVKIEISIFCLLFFFVNKLIMFLLTPNQINPWN